VRAPIRWTIAAAAGLAAGAAAWFRAAPIEPHLEVRVAQPAAAGDAELWSVTVTARGGGSVPEVRVEPRGTGLRLVGDGVARDLRSGWAATFRLLRDAGASEPLGVAVAQSGPSARTYELPLEPTR
jgi:hypothetical protein